jgi:hypothetical protein
LDLFSRRFCDMFLLSFLKPCQCLWKFWYIFTLVSSLIPVAIVGATRFYTTFVDILIELNLFSHWFHVLMSSHERLDRILELYICSYSSHGAFCFSAKAVSTCTTLSIGISLVSYHLEFPPRLPSSAHLESSSSQAFYRGPITEAGTGDIGIYTGTVMGHMACLEWLRRDWWESSCLEMYLGCRMCWYVIAFSALAIPIA